MVRKINLTKRADNKFDEILIYINREFGIKPAIRFLEKTYSFFDIIVQFPQIGRPVDNNKIIFGFVLEEHITIFYRYSDSAVVILNFFYNRMSPKKKAGNL